MKICMFTNAYLPHVGGVARSVALFTEDLRRKNHQVLVIAPTFSESPEPDPHILRVPAIQNFNASDFSVRIPVPFLIDQEMDAFAPDLIHSHHPFLLGDAALRAARRRRRPLVFTHHTQYEKYTHYVPFDSEPLKQFVSNLATAYANLCSAVVAPSDSIARLIRRRGVEVPVKVIPTGVDLAFFEEGSGDVFRSEWNIPRKTFVIGTCSRLAPEKNLAFLAHAAADYICGDPAALFLVLGEGPSGEDIRRVFADHGLEKQLIMTGSQSGTALSNAYNAMDLFVFASKTETQGLVLLEAMAAGKPVMALDASGTREVVEDGRNGRLLPAETTEKQFSEEIAAFRKCPETNNQWRAAARRTAQELSRRNCARQLETLYRSVLEADGAPSDETDDALISWNKLLEGIKAEWELLTEKTAAAVKKIPTE